MKYSEGAPSKWKALLGSALFSIFTRFTCILLSSIPEGTQIQKRR